MSLYIYKKYNKLYSAWSEEKSSYFEVWGKGANLPTYSGYDSRPVWTSEGYENRGTYGVWSSAYSTVSNSDTRSEYTMSSYSVDSYDDTWYEWWTTRDTWYRTRTFSKGTYVGEVTAEEGFYPDNGATGDYWYIKDRLAFPQLGIRVDNVWLTSELGWCKIDSVWREIDEIHINVNGIWKKSE